MTALLRSFFAAFLFFAPPALAVTFTSKQNGAFLSASTWNEGTVPTAGSDVVVSHQITLSALGPHLNTLTVNAGKLTLSGSASLAITASVALTGGTLDLQSGSFTLGPAGGGNKPLTMTSGGLNISGGTAKVFGKISMTGGSFVMSGGNLFIDPNSGASSTSVATGNTIFAIAGATSCAVSGGIITFVDTPYTVGNKTFTYSATPTNVSWLGNRMVFGDQTGRNNPTSGNTSGFIIDTSAAGSSFMRLGDVVVNGSDSINNPPTYAVGKRFVSGPSQIGNGFDIAGDLTINASSEVRTLLNGAPLRISGNIENNGFCLDQAGIYFSQRGGPNTVLQTVTNGTSYQGIFNNFVLSGPNVANFSKLVINNTASPIAVQMNFGDGVDVDGAVIIGGSLAFENGILDIGSDNQFVFRAGATASRINGALLRGTGPGGGGQMGKVFPAGPSSFTYHIVDNIGTYDYTPVTVKLTSNILPPGGSQAISIGLYDQTHPSINAGSIATGYLSRFWRFVSTPGGSFLGTITSSYVAEDVVGTATDYKASTWFGAAPWAEQPATLGSNQFSGVLDSSMADPNATLAHYTLRTATPDASPTPTPTPRPSATPTSRPSATPTSRPSATPTPRPSATPTPRPSATPTPRPSATPTPRPSATPTPRPSATPTPRPSATPTPSPTPSLVLIKVGRTPSSGGTVTGTGKFAVGNNHRIIARRKPGFAFVSWTENGRVVSTSPRYKFTVQTGRRLIAHFKRKPAKATLPIPIRSAIVERLRPRLQWTRGAHTDRFQVLFGIQTNLNSSDNLGKTKFTEMLSPRLETGKIYFWRVDAINAFGKTRGDVWTFTTD